MKVEPTVLGNGFAVKGLPALTDENRNIPVSLADLEAMSGISRRVIYNSIYNGHLKGCKLGRKFYVFYADFLGWLGAILPGAPKAAQPSAPATVPPSIEGASAEARLGAQQFAADYEASCSRNLLNTDCSAASEQSVSAVCAFVRQLPAQEKGAILDAMFRALNFRHGVSTLG